MLCGYVVRLLIRRSVVGVPLDAGLEWVYLSMKGHNVLAEIGLEHDRSLPLGNKQQEHISRRIAEILLKTKSKAANNHQLPYLDISKLFL